MADPPKLIMYAPNPMFRAYFTLLLSTLACLPKTKRALLLENLALRQQLIALRRTSGRVQVVKFDRQFWIIIKRFWIDWRSALLFVQPETVLKWHRDLARKHWAKLSAKKKAGRPRIDKEIQALITQMARDNKTSGAGRIYGELLKLGFNVSERSVARYMPKHPERRIPWRTFLKNHSQHICAVDLFTVFTASFRQLYGIVVMDHHRRTLLFTNATYFPTSDWIIQQICNALPGQHNYLYLILDNDRKFGHQIDKKLADLFLITAKHTSVASPWQNGICEPLIGTLRRDCLDHMIILGEGHLRAVLSEYASYYNNDRTHRALKFQTPIVNKTKKKLRTSHLAVINRCGGLHHRYEWQCIA